MKHEVDLTARTIILGSILAATVLFSPVFFSAAQAREEIDGLIIEQSQTKIGHDFFQQFTAQWDPPSSSQEYNIFIIERASPQWGSWVWIKVNDTIVYQGVVKPRYEEIRGAVQTGLAQAMDYLFWLQNLRSAGGPDDL